MVIYLQMVNTFFVRAAAADAYIEENLDTFKAGPPSGESSSDSEGEEEGDKDAPDAPAPDQ